MISASDGPLKGHFLIMINTNWECIVIGRGIFFLKSRFLFIVMWRPLVTKSFGIDIDIEMCYRVGMT